MRKNLSTSRIPEYNHHLQKMKQRFSSGISKNGENRKNLKFLQLSNYPMEYISNIKTTKTSNRNISLNPNQNDLYDELMFLKKKVNSLNAQISFAKSQKRKKDQEINSKKKEIANYISDIQMSKDISPVSIDKLKDSNMISLIKKEYYNAQKLLESKIKEEKNLESYLKKAKPNNELKKNDDLENQLKILVAKYNEIQKKNNEDSKKLHLMRNLAQVFQMNHTKIEEMKNLLSQTEKNINRLKIIANDMYNENSKNNDILRKQNISKANVNKHIEHLMNQKKNKEEIVKMKAIHEKKIKSLEEELKDLKSKCNRNDTDIDSLKKELSLIEKYKNEDQFKLRTFNYKQLTKIDKDPLENVNSKILLLNSLIDESNNNIKKYKENILALNEQLKEMGSEPFDITDLLNTENNKKTETNNTQTKKDENNDELNNKTEKENNNQTPSKSNLKENEKENAMNKINIDSDTNKKKIESTKEEETKNDNLNNINNTNLIKPLSEQNNEIKDTTQKNINENNLNEIKIDNNNNNNEENKEQRISSNINNEGVIINSTNNNNNLEEENNNNEININKIDNNNDNSNSNNNIDIINTNSNNNTNNNNQKLFTEEEFSEFTFVLLQNLEAKKITIDIAKEKIILLQNKSEELPNDKFIEQMCHNILTCLNNKNEESIQKLNKWLYFLLNISENKQNLMTEKFISLLANIKIYTPEEELLLSKKVKKYLLPKKEIVLSKLDPFKNKYISFLFLKQLIEEQKIDMKDDYFTYLFYSMKKFDDPGVSLYDLKVQNLYDILDNDEHDSKMDEESDIEISNEEFTTIISNFILQLLNYLNKNKKNLRDVVGDLIQTLNVDEELNQGKIEIALIEPFINRMKEIGITINNDIETFCIFNRYKLTDDYEIISINLLERELENFREINLNRNLSNNNNNIDNKDKVMEKVQEETEDNASIS